MGTCLEYCGNAHIYLGKLLTWFTLAEYIRLVVSGTHPASLSGQDIEDKCLHDEGDHNLEDNQGDDVEAQEVQSHEPVHIGVKF